MDKITDKEFMLRQPDYPNSSATDEYYIGVANELAKLIRDCKFGATIPESLVSKVALTLTDYLQDIVSDAGLWRSFVVANRELYGWSVPFHDIPEDYVDFELNREDVRFLVWYAVAMLWDETRKIYPHDAALLECADVCFNYMESCYEDAPIPEKFSIARGLEFKDPEDTKEIYHLGNWLFLHSYLLTPAFSMSLSEIIESVDKKSPDAFKEINEKLEEAMMELPTGPLALYTHEWVYLMLEGKLPKEKQSQQSKDNHPYYDVFVKATGGDRIKFLGSYEALNNFLIEGLGWEAGKEHLPMARDGKDFVLLVNPKKGMLLAKNVARCIKAPQNPFYNEDYAKRNAFKLMTVRGICPGDLLRYCIEQDWLPDAVFPGTQDHALVKSNADFILRCYLQLYYRD